MVVALVLVATKSTVGSAVEPLKPTTPWVKFSVVPASDTRPWRIWNPPLTRGAAAVPVTWMSPPNSASMPRPRTKMRPGEVRVSPARCRVLAPGAAAACRAADVQHRHRGRDVLGDTDVGLGDRDPAGRLHGPQQRAAEERAASSVAVSWSDASGEARSRSA